MRTIIAALGAATAIALLSGCAYTGYGYDRYGYGYGNRTYYGDRYARADYGPNCSYDRYGALWCHR